MARNEAFLKLDRRKDGVIRRNVDLEEEVIGVGDIVQQADGQPDQVEVAE